MQELYPLRDLRQLPVRAHKNTRTFDSFLMNDVNESYEVMQFDAYDVFVYYVLMFILRGN